MRPSYVAANRVRAGWCFGRSKRRKYLSLPYRKSRTRGSVHGRRRLTEVSGQFFSTGDFGNWRRLYPNWYSLTKLVLVRLSAFIDATMLSANLQICKRRTPSSTPSDLLNYRHGHPSRPSSPKEMRLTRDQRRDFPVPRNIGHSYDEIATHLTVSVSAVQYTCATEQATPQHKNAGVKPQLAPEQVNDLIDFVSASSRNRCLSYP